MDKITFPGALAPPRPYLIVADAAAALDFYAAAFDAVEEERRATPDGARIAHATLSLFGGIVELADDAPRDTQGLRAPTALGATTLTLHVDFADRASVDRVLARAEKAGATITFSAREMDWGAWYGRLRDPFGHAWSFAGALA